MTFPFGVTVGIYRPGDQDWTGDKAPGEVHDIGPCAIWPDESSKGSARTAGATETTVRRDTTTTVMSIAIADSDADVLSSDLAYLPGDNRSQPARWQINGSPSVYTSPFTGWRAGLLIQVKRVSG